MTAECGRLKRAIARAHNPDARAITRVASRPTPNLVLDHSRPRPYSRRERVDGQQGLTQCRSMDGNSRSRCSISRSRQAGREPSFAPLRSVLRSSRRISSRLRSGLFRPCNYAIVFSEQRKAVAKTMNRSQTGSRVKNEELPFSPRLRPDSELRNPYTTVLNIEPHVHLNLRAGALSCFASLRDDSLRLRPRQSQELTCGGTATGFQVWQLSQDHSNFPAPCTCRSMRVLTLEFGNRHGHYQHLYG